MALANDSRMAVLPHAGQKKARAERRVPATATFASEHLGHYLRGVRWHEDSDRTRPIGHTHRNEIAAVLTGVKTLGPAYESVVDPLLDMIQSRTADVFDLFGSVPLCCDFFMTAPRAIDYLVRHDSHPVLKEYLELVPAFD